MEIKFLIDGQEHIGAVDDNGYVSVTFTKNTRDEIEITPLESCGGVTFVDDIQLEKSDIATPYENPALVQGPATGLIKDIRALQYSIHDPERGLTSRFAQMAQGFEQEVVDLIGGYSRQGQTINGLFTDVYSPDGRVSQAIQTVDGFKQTVEDLEAGTGTTFEQLSNGFRQRIDEYLGNSTKFSQIESSVDAIELAVGDPDSLATSLLTSDLWRTEVTNLTQQRVADELKQEFETVLSPVNVVNEEEHNWGETFSLGKYFHYGGLHRDVPTYLQNRVNHVLEITMPATQNKGQFVYVQTKNLDGDWVAIGASFNLPTGQFRITHEFTSTVFSTSNADYRLVIENGGNPPVTVVYTLKIYRNDEVQVPIIGEETGAISSQITQLYNMINLSVLGKDGAMSRIAMGEEGIQIDGKLLHITAKTYIDNAVIKSAMIDTLDAGKITTGELNASLIRVVNLDAKSIAGNEASFIKAMFEGMHSVVTITSDRISARRNDGTQSVAMTNRGLEIIGPYGRTGSMQYGTDDRRPRPSLFFNWERNHDLFMGVVDPATNLAPPTMVLRGTGNYGIEVHKPLMASGSNYGIDITWGEITGRETNVRIMNHNRTGGIQINSGDISYLTSSGWRSLNTWLT